MADRAPEPTPWRRWADLVTEFGECPVWDDRVSALYAIDLYGPSVVRSAACGPTTTWSVPSRPGSIALTSDPSVLLVAIGAGIHLLDLDSGGLELVSTAPFDPLHYRLNDGRCDRAGRFWVGASRQPGLGLPKGSGHFYRLDEHGLVACIDGVTIANGIAFSPDGGTLYQADVVTRRILSYDYDPDTGAVSGERTFARVPDGSFPDGAAVDGDGGYWIALYGGGVIVRFTPAGDPDRVVRAPTSHPTMIAFGGPGGRLAFVTTGRRFTPEDVLAREAHAGSVFCADLGVAGIIEPHFAFPPSARRAS